MTPIYIRSGVLFRDSIVVQTGAGTFVTGLGNGDFTKQLSNATTGNLSVTGLTITQVDATNNPGVYDVLIPAALVATNGSYTLKIYRTSDPTYSWTQEYVATSDGTPSGGGTLSFTATANDGRVEDEVGSPIEGATVYLAYSGYLTSFTTDASGLWGPWYTDPSIGAVTITVVKSNYSVETATLTVGVSSVTGPGSDIGLTPISTGSSVAASELWSFARRMSGNKTGAQADVRIKQLCNDAVDRIAMDIGPNGNWYIRRSYISIKEPYATGTITLTQDASTCVLAGGTFPTWAANGRLYINGQPLIDVATRNSDTSLTIATDWGGETGSYSYVLSLDNYPLESNAYEFMGIMNGQSWPYMAGAVTIERLWEMQNAIVNLSQRGAWAYAIANNRMHLYPYPSEDAQVAYIYRARPAPLNDESDLADVDPTWLSTLRHLITYYVAVYFGDCVAGTSEQCLRIYEDSLSRLVANLKTPRGIGGRPNLTRQDYWRAICRTSP